MNNEAEAARRDAVELKPCPWCKARPQARRDIPIGFVGCVNPDCPVTPQVKIYCSDDPVGDAIEDWNARGVKRR